jgi:hypothetical protein
MADTEIRRVIEIETSGSVRSLAQLKAEADASASAVNGLEKGTVAYDQALAQSKKAQSDYNYALKMNAADAKAATGSYNSMVAAMGRLKQEWRATSDVAKRAELGKEINDINNRLKEMDASVGQFGRNVGDYANQVKGALRDIPSYAKNIHGPLKDVSDQVGLLSKQPLFGIVTLLVPVITKIVEELKESDSAMQSLNKIGKAFQPVLSFFEKVLDSLVGYVGQLVEKVLEFTQGGLFQKIINGVVGVGNAIMNFVVAPFKGIIAAIKVFKEEGVKGLGDAGKAFLTEMKQGVAFKANYEAGQVLAQTLTAGAKSKAKESGQAIAKEIAEETQSALMKVEASWYDREDRGVAERRKREEEQRAFDQEQLEYEKAYQAEIADAVGDSVAEMVGYYQSLEEAEKRRRETVKASAEAIESILGSVAQAYNDELQAQVQAGQISEREARKRFAFVKAFQLSQAVINTASGVMSVFSAPDNITMTQKWLQAAAVAARGAASIASIASSSLSTGAAASQAGQVSNLMNAGAPAPQVQTLVPITRVGTNAEDEERLNERQRAQRVYVVYSDIAQAGNQVAVQTAESSW